MNDGELAGGRKLAWRHRSLLVVGAIIVLLAVVAVLGEHHLRGPLLHAIAARTGRQIRVDGVFEVHLFSRNPTIVARQVSIGNPSWMPPGITAQVDALTVNLQWQASLVPLGIRRLEIQGASLHLVRDASGRANWHSHPEGPSSGPPLIKSLLMPNARVELHDQRRHLEFSGDISAGDARDGAAPPLRIEGAGQLNGKAVSFLLTGDPLATVRRDHPYEFALEERSTANRLTFRGTISQPFDMRVLQGHAEASGPDLKDLYFLAGIRLPDTAPYRLAATFTRQGMRFSFTDLIVNFGESDLKGRLTADDSSGQSAVEGELSSELLRLADIGARAAGRAPEEAATSGLRFPETPFRLGGLKRSDARVSFHIRSLGFSSHSLQSISGAVVVDHGVLSVTLSRASLGDGKVSGEARLDATRELPRGQLNLTVIDLPLEQFKGKGGEDAPFTGLLSGRVHVSGEGKSPHGLAATANGTMTAVVPHGAMRASLAELVSLELSGALGVMLKKHGQTDIRCGVVSFDAHDGLVAARTLVLDTDKALITGAGDIHMDSETLDLTLRGRPKSVGLALRSAVSIGGTLEHPQIRLKAGSGATQTGAAAAIGYY